MKNISCTKCHLLDNTQILPSEKLNFSIINVSNLFKAFKLKQIIKEMSTKKIRLLMKMTTTKLIPV